MNYRTLTLLGFSMILSLIIPIANVSSDESQIQIDELILNSDHLLTQDHDGLLKTKEGITTNSGYNHYTYTSLPIQAPIAFNAVASQWMADIPAGTAIEISLRTGLDGSDWSAWQSIEPSPDWNRDEDDDIVGDMLAVPAEDGRHQFLQVRIIFDRQLSSADPILEELQLIFIDSTQGPSVQEMINQQKTLDAQQKAEQPLEDNTPAKHPKPFVISRDVWCTDPRCNYTEGLEYHPVTHLILHHTVSSSNGDPAALLRAIWAYHTITRGWGDIGYNFLVDTDGTLFEGHLGGDDVVGIHARQANVGSMALALMGTYSVIDPPQAMVEAAIDLFAWKADQKGIDVFDASDVLPNVAYGLPNLMGHRDVEGTTQCPGNHGHTMLPTIRDEVAARIGLTTPYIYVDELSNAFSRSNANWYTASLQCGHNTHAWYTWSTTEPTSSTNWGEWQPNVPVDGRYQIDAHIPYCNTGAPETGGAAYLIQHAHGSSNLTADQNTHVGLWMPLGEFDLRAGTGNVIRLTDLTTTDSRLGVWFDALRLLKLETIPSAVLQSPTDGSWFTQREITFDWTIEHPEKVAKTTFQVATDADFQKLISNKEWPSLIESVPHRFDQDYAALYWRVILSTEDGSSYASLPVRFGIDTQPPESSINQPLWLKWNNQYLLTWQGEDELSEVQDYTIEYLQEGSQGTGWQTWLDNVTQTSAFFNPPAPDGVYAFRSQATDTLGNLETAHQTPDTSSEQAVSLSHAIILPIIIAD